MSFDAKHRSDMGLWCSEIRAADKVAIERFGIPGVVLMENAGGAAAREVFALLVNPSSSSVCIVAGAGNNGGDGFVVARHLAGRGVKVIVLLLAEADKLKGDALINYRIIEKMGLPIILTTGKNPKEVREEVETYAAVSDLIVDAMLGTGAVGAPREPYRSAIEAINEAGKMVVALDITSGLNGDSGEVEDIAIRANLTVTFAAMKKGFTNPAAQGYLGRIVVASIGIDMRWLRDE